MNFTSTGDVIKYLRKRKGLSQEALGDVLGVKRVTVQKYEADKITINADIIRKLCNCFGVPPWVLLFPEDGRTNLILDTVEDYYAMFYSLNHKGRMKVSDYIADLSKIEEYRRDQNL